MVKVFVHGRLVRDPELRKTTSGKSVCSFTVASDKRRREDGANFIDCTAWNGLAEMICKYFQKGKEIVLSGDLDSRKYEDRNGNNRTAWEVIVENVEFCGSKSDNGSQTGFGYGGDSAPAPSYAAPAQPLQTAPENLDVIVDDSEDIPF